jgi:aminoglycoside 3-N-acetyltransferase
MTLGHHRRITLLVTEMASRTDAAVTRDSMAVDLRRLGVRAGQTIIVHSSLSSLGWVDGGPTAVVHALIDAVGDDGTVVVPTQTTTNTDPSTWRPPHDVAPARWPGIRENMPAFDPLNTPSAGVGVIAECLRTWPGALRSDHPQTSFAALGRRAEWIVTGHRLESQLGEDSPVARLEDCDARVLLLGVGFNRCTAFHLAEYRQPQPVKRTLSCAILTPQGRRWVSYDAVALSDHDFAAIGADFILYSDEVERHPVGCADSWLLPVRSAVSFATKWIADNRQGSITFMTTTATVAPHDVDGATLIDLGGVPLTDLLKHNDSVLMDLLRRLTGDQENTPSFSAFSSAM